MRDMAGKEPTAKQAKILTFIRSSLQCGRNPSLAEIRRHIGCKSRNTVVGQLMYLERKGLVYRNRDGKLVAS